MSRPSDLEVKERTESLEVTAVIWLVDPEVLTDANMVADAVVIEPSYPSLADELPAGDEAVDRGLAEGLDVSLR